MKPRAILFLAALLSAPDVGADSNISPGQATVWGGNVGWMNWRPSAADGALIGEYVCSGFVYGANVGWIHLGNGKPANGIHYQNDRASDFGVNHDQQGRLWGLAYGANIGWISFETNGAPRVDLRSGKLSGQVYGANVGWINLADPAFSLRADSIAEGLDEDTDGIPDAFELRHAGSLSVLNGDGDFDKDGVSDSLEYRADTSPADPEDYLAILTFATSGPGLTTYLSWKSQPTREYRVLTRPQFGVETPWINGGVPLLRGDGTTISVVLTNQTSVPQAFYQIQVLRPLTP